MSLSKHQHRIDFYKSLTPMTHIDHLRAVLKELKNDVQWVKNHHYLKQDKLIIATKKLQGFYDQPPYNQARVNKDLSALLQNFHQKNVDLKMLLLTRCDSALDIEFPAVELAIENNDNRTMANELQRVVFHFEDAHADYKKIIKEMEQEIDSYQPMFQDNNLVPILEMLQFAAFSLNQYAELAWDNVSLSIISFVNSIPVRVKWNRSK